MLRPEAASLITESGDRNAVLSDRRNIVVIADEAHRSQYDFIDGFARHMRDALPQASFVGFTGTPIEPGPSAILSRRRRPCILIEAIPDDGAAQD
jgi:hypothetical protein